MNQSAVASLLSASRGVEYSLARCDSGDRLDAETWAWARNFSGLLPARFWIHDDEPAHAAAAQLGCCAFAQRDRVFLGALPPGMRKHVLRHELVHLAQMQLALRHGRVASDACVEQEADRLAAAQVADPVRHGADPDRAHPFFWLVPIGVGLYIVLRPGIANAPGPLTPTHKSPSLPQIVLESLAVMAIPGGALSFGARVGIGFLGSSAIGGAAGAVSVRAIEDVFNGAPSAPLLYLHDAATGAIIGFVVAGGFRLVGKAGTWSLDRLATYGLKRADLAATQLLSEAAAVAPVDAAAAQKILQSQGLGGSVSQWYLNRRGLLILYRGQTAASDEILSPLARQEGLAASEELVRRMRAAGVTDAEIADYTANYHSTRTLEFGFGPTSLIGERVGAAGIPSTRIPGIAADFGPGGVIYVLRVPRALATRASGYGGGLALENEFVILNRVPGDAIVQTMPVERVAPLLLDDTGKLIPGLR